MAHIILHQYDVSPFSEKVRVVFGIKNLSWSAVDQPVIMPKPELVPLTGGYRKIPVMQIGADIYCDTAVIVRELDRRFPDPPLAAGADHGIGHAIAMWADRALFMTVVQVIFGSVGETVDEAFKKDRTELMGRPFDTDAMKAIVPPARENLRAQLGWLDAQLGGGHDFLLGGAPGLADAATVHSLTFLRWFLKAPDLAMLDEFPRLLAWEARMKAIGHGNRSEMSRADALAVARAATPVTTPRADPHEPNGLKPGDLVSVMADDYGRDPITGELVASSADTISIRRTDPDLGELCLHFPRTGFWVMRA